MKNKNITPSRTLFLIQAALFLFLNSPNKIYSQADTASRFFFGWQIATGMMQNDFSTLHKYEHLPGTPSQINFNYLSPVIFIGDPQKIFISVPFGVSFTGQRKGNYNGYTISANSGGSYAGLDISFPLTSRFDKKFLQAIYLSLGGQYTNTTIYSKATRSNTTMKDTSFSFENSRAKNVVANAELMFEFFRLGKKPASVRIPLILTVGYNFQLQKPKWSGEYIRNAGDENPAVNSGGFYCRLGFNIWTTKQFWKGWNKQKVKK
jgi:hypothetical protein